MLVSLKTLRLTINESMSVSIRWKRGSTNDETSIKLISGKDEEQVWEIDSQFKRLTKFYKKEGKFQAKPVIYSYLNFQVLFRLDQTHLEWN